MNDPNEMSEGEYLDTLGWAVEVELSEEELEERLQHRRELAKRHYDVAKLTKIGEPIICPMCEVVHTKTTYHKVFCGRKQRGRSTCRDIYHNFMTDDRLFMTKLMTR